MALCLVTLTDLQTRRTGLSYLYDLLMQNIGLLFCVVKISVLKYS